MPESTITVSIGRRQGTGENLSTKAWASFRAEVEGALDLLDATVYFAGLGGGIYEGVYEESATWVAGTSATSLAVFRSRLASLAHRFGQESIAVTVGETSFVEARTARTEAA